MNTTDTIQSLKKAEKTIQCMLEHIKQDILKNISEYPDPDIKILSESPAVCVVSLKHIKERNNLSAEYYMPEVQAKMVYKYLSDAKTLNDLSGKIENLIANGYVVKDKTKYALHPNTLNVLINWQEQLK